MITSKVRGGDKVIKRLMKFEDKVPTIVDDVLELTAVHTKEQMVQNIGRNSSKDTGHLAQQCYGEKGQDFVRIGNRADYAGYVEFGTGKHVTVPPEFTGIASDARSMPRKNFKDALQAIKDWAKRHGKEKYAYPILMSILREGLMPKPFLYPAYLSGKRKLITEAGKAIKEALRKK